MTRVIYDNYTISDKGVVTNIVTNKVLKVDNNQRYSRIRLFNKEKKPKKFLVHRLVADAFLPRVEGKNIINHIDGNYYNNEVTNLEWCTQKENVQHSWANGLSKMTDERKAKLSNKVGQYTLEGNLVKVWSSTQEAGASGYTQSSISLVCNGKRNKHKGFIWKFV